MKKTKKQKVHIKTKKMKKINMGSFFGKNMYLETEENDTFDYVKEFRNWRESEKKLAIEQYKGDVFLRQMNKRVNQIKNSWWHRFCFL